MGCLFRETERKLWREGGDENETEWEREENKQRIISRERRVQQFSFPFRFPSSSTAVLTFQPFFSSTCSTHRGDTAAEVVTEAPTLLCSGDSGE